MRRTIAIAALTGAFAMTGCSADSTGNAQETLFVEMRDVEGSQEGALTVRATNVRFDKLATSVLNALIEYDRAHHPDMPEVSFGFDSEVAQRVVSFNLENERARTAILRALLEVGECHNVGSTRDGKEHMTFSRQPPPPGKPAVSKADAQTGDSKVVDEDSPEYQAMLKTWRAFRECTNKGDYEGAKAFVRLKGHETDPKKSWPEFEWEKQALVLTSRGKIDMARSRVRGATIKHNLLKTGRLSLARYYEGRERGGSARIDFVFIDGNAYITKP